MISFRFVNSIKKQCFNHCQSMRYHFISCEYRVRVHDTTYRFFPGTSEMKIPRTRYADDVILLLRLQSLCVLCHINIICDILPSYQFGMGKSFRLWFLLQRDTLWAIVKILKAFLLSIYVFCRRQKQKGKSY